MDNIKSAENVHCTLFQWFLTFFSSDVLLYNKHCVLVTFEVSMKCFRAPEKTDFFFALNLLQSFISSNVEKY